jgi:hypothetical protein
MPRVGVIGLSDPTFWTRAVCWTDARAVGSGSGPGVVRRGAALDESLEVVDDR